MDRLKQSVIAKIIAWILCVTSVLGAVALGALTMIGIGENLFDKTYDEAMHRIYETVNIDYSIKAFRNRENSTYAKMLAENYFQYGIIKSNSLEDINFNDKLSYVETNISDEELKNLDPKKLFLYQIKNNHDGTMIEGFSVGYYGDYDNISATDAENSDSSEYSSEWTYLYADGICYDITKGIVYYRAEGNYYPVQNISLNFNGIVYNYNYDFEKEAYKLNYTRPYEGEDDLANNFAEQVTNDGEITYIQKILSADGNKNTIHLTELNNTTFNYGNWGLIVLDNIRELDGSELILIDSNNYSKEYFIDEAGYFLDENYTLVVSQPIQSDYYWVVSLVPESVPKELTNSLYNQYNWVIDFYYSINANILQGLVISVLIAILSFVFLACAAGHRRNREEIVLTAVDRIPVDLLTVVVGVLEFTILLLSCDIIIDLLDIKEAFLILTGCVICVMTVIGLGYVLSLCVRFKNGKWWRSSICYRIFSRLRELFHNIFRNLNLLWKLIVIIGVISFFEFWIVTETSKDFIVLCWLIEKMVLCIVVFLLAIQMYELQKASQHIAEGDLAHKIDTNKMFWECKKHGENLNKIGEGMSKAVDERMKSEHFRTELISNVSHDIKTPLTSIINYVDLLEKEELDNEKASEYLEVLDRQSSKLKKLTEDLIEASKASSGNVTVNNERMEVSVFLTQTVGEFEEKLSLAGLELIMSKLEESVYIMADGKHLWRIVDNLMNNICKYAQQGTRVYVTLETLEKKISITFRNVSKYPLNISGEELMERFVRGDKSRNTEGHGLGLSIAQSLMKVIGGDMRIIVDGYLFKVILIFNRCETLIPDCSCLEKI